ncbi:hypothetical protein [Amnibacterium setariae]|uniref:Uncharacterized protein n=1 Tax=Amnibacterium setariae TaxID=2306585 RepID=A0A3A1TWM6_9MICO|nr:hypothetical protein [Amnibacterium setariae]RIX28612.1 hypothetical protein D1781_14475 [Amnibacterium setariae]
MVDVDELYVGTLATLRRPPPTVEQTADLLMQLVREALEAAWEEGRGRGAAEWTQLDLPGNPYSAEEWPDWSL